MKRLEYHSQDDKETYTYDHFMEITPGGPNGGYFNTDENYVQIELHDKHEGHIQMLDRKQVQELVSWLQGWLNERWLNEGWLDEV